VTRQNKRHKKRSKKHWTKLKKKQVKVAETTQIVILQVAEEVEMDLTVNPNGQPNEKWWELGVKTQPNFLTTES